MAAFTLLDVDMYAGGLDLSCFTNQVNVNVDVAEVDVTTFCSGGWTVPIGGLKSSVLSFSGPTDMATATAANKSAVDEYLNVQLGGDWPVTVVPAGSSAGAVAYFTNSCLYSRTILSGAVGDMAMHSVEYHGKNPVVRGVVETAQTITATGNSTGQQLGAVASGQRIWAAVHFLTADGTTPSITVKIQSDDNSGFTSPTDRITFTAATAKGAEFASAMGPFTDDYWRAEWTVSGTTPSFDTRIVFGIY